MAIPPELMASASEVTKLSKLSVYRGGQPERAFWRTRSRPSSQVLWRGTHWCVTDRGIESLDGCHVLDGLKLTDKHTIDIAAGFDWDAPDDFADAWRVAVKLFREKGQQFPPKRVREAILRTAGNSRCQNFRRV